MSSWGASPGATQGSEKPLLSFGARPEEKVRVSSPSMAWLGEKRDPHCNLRVPGQPSGSLCFLCFFFFHLCSLPERFSLFILFFLFVWLFQVFVVSWGIFPWGAWTLVAACGLQNAWA